LALANGDKVTITIDKKSDKDFRIFGITPSIWELTGNGVDLTINTTQYNNVDNPSLIFREFIHPIIMSYSIIFIYMKLVE